MSAIQSRRVTQDSNARAARTITFLLAGVQGSWANSRDAAFIFSPENDLTRNNNKIIIHNTIVVKIK